MNGRWHNARGKCWSKLKKRIEDLFADNLNLQIHCTAYTVTYKFTIGRSPRHWLVLNKEIIFDFPGDFYRKGPIESQVEYLDSEGSTLSILIQQYIETPLNELLSAVFPKDRWGFVDLLRAADRRIGKKKLLDKYENIASDSAVKKILDVRFASQVCIQDDSIGVEVSKQR